MSIALYGNINGQSYRPPTINLLDSSKSQKNDPVTVSNAFPDTPSATVNISEEGLKAKMRSYIGENGKIAVPEMTEDQKAEREAKIKAFQESIVYYEESPFKINITREEGNIMRSFEPEEYTSIIERMKKDDPDTYVKHKAALDEAKANGDTSTVFREYAGAYKWAYGDIFDKIHEKEPEVDIYVKSASTPKDHNYNFINGAKNLVISTDELKLLQSQNPKDAEKQEKLWLDIFDRINNSTR